jgi:hypothetical protein
MNTQHFKILLVFLSSWIRVQIQPTQITKSLDMTVHKCVNQVTVPWPAWDAGLELNS